MQVSVDRMGGVHGFLFKSIAGGLSAESSCSGGRSCSLRSTLSLVVRPRRGLDALLRAVLVALDPVERALWETGARERISAHGWAAPACASLRPAPKPHPPAERRGQPGARRSRSCWLLAGLSRRPARADAPRRRRSRSCVMTKVVAGDRAEGRRARRGRTADLTNVAPQDAPAPCRRARRRRAEHGGRADTSWSAGRTDGAAAGTPNRSPASGSAA